MEKLNLQPVSNIELFSIYTESELGMLGIAGKACEKCNSPMVVKFRKKK